MKKLFLSIVCIGGLFLIVQAQDSLSAREHIKYLSSKELHGRGAAYKGEIMAAEYIINNLREYGVEPLTEEYRQKYDHPAFVMEGDVKCCIGKQVLTAGEDYRILPFSRPLNGKYTLIHIKPSDLINNKQIKAINKKYADIADHCLIYIDERQADFKNEKDEELYKKACAKSEYENPFNTMGIIRNLKTRMVWGLSNTDFKRPHAYIYMNNDKITDKTKSIEFYYQNELMDFVHYNVCGVIKGTEQPEKYIVLTCHYDHLGAMGKDVYFPGAHDNASGCAFVLNMAKYFQEHPCKYSIAFLFFAGEESGLLGSKYFTENPLIPLENIQYAINFDLLGGGNEGFTLVNSTEGKGMEIYKRLVEINEDEQLVPKIAQRSNAANSDHYFFTQHKVPAIFMYTMGGKVGGYHDISDTNENCSLAMFDNIFRLFTTLIEKEE